jgi:hypothetical protein
MENLSRWRLQRNCRIVLYAVTHQWLTKHLLESGEH